MKCRCGGDVVSRCEPIGRWPAIFYIKDIQVVSVTYSYCRGCQRIFSPNFWSEDGIKIKLDRKSTTPNSTPVNGSSGMLAPCLSTRNENG